MLDFVNYSTNMIKKDLMEITPIFIIKRSKDLMIRGGDFYACWIEDEERWTVDEQDIFDIIDREIEKRASELRKTFPGFIKKRTCWDSSSGVVDAWRKYTTKQLRDCFVSLDSNILFSNHVLKKTDYATKTLSYPLEAMPIDNYDRIISTLYSPEERHKIEWCIGAIVSGDSKQLQKFIVFYGSAGTGKSTIINIIQQLFEGYYSVFDAKALGSSSNAFALDSFRQNPLVAIQHDGDLSRIEDNTRLNSLVSHETMTVNEKYKASYTNQFSSFLIMGTNRAVKITDSRSGLIRRLIDVSPSGNKLDVMEYNIRMHNIKFELSGIAQHCLDVYEADKHYYDSYTPIAMLGASNDFYNFIEDSYVIFERDGGVTLKAAWAMYNTFVEYSKVAYPLNYRNFKEELRNYFHEMKERYDLDGVRVRNYFVGFRKDKLNGHSKTVVTEEEIFDPLELNMTESIFDTKYYNNKAQYASKKETPIHKWCEVTTTLQDLKTNKLHYVILDKQHIVIDFDLKDESGNKSLELNKKEAAKFPKTYTEVSKGGQGLHLHYIYDGDVDMLSALYDHDIEIKTYKNALRRRLSVCNNIDIAHISSGLPLKEKKPMLNKEIVMNDKQIKVQIIRNLNKEIHNATKPSIDMINKILDDAYESGVVYDVTPLKHRILSFARQSSNQAKICIDIVSNMKFKSESEKTDLLFPDETPLGFYDVEVFPNLFVVCYKIRGKDTVYKLVNPEPKEIETMLNIIKPIGFNNRKYDNHIIYARHIGYSIDKLYELSTKIVSKNKKASQNAMFREAYNLSYTDIYDFSTKKQSLKKWQIELGLNHKELGLDWTKPVPEELWEKVVDYCANDVITTEQVFEHLASDFKARLILSEISGLTPNDTTNSLTTKIIFGNDKNPQGMFKYRDMGDITRTAYILEWDKTTNTFEYVPATKEDIFDEYGNYKTYNVFNKDKNPIYPGYRYNFGTSIYRDTEVGEGGMVYAQPGMWWMAEVLDIASQHPTSAIKENIFGDIYTPIFADLVNVRLHIKHEEYDKIEPLFDGKLMKYLTNKDEAKILSTALKIPINSVYGLTSAHFDNAFRDPRNVDNIVAKRGSLFMVNLKHEVENLGYTVAHIKTDSIKIPGADNFIIDFVTRYGDAYGYTFEHENTYLKMCLVNNAVYIAFDKHHEAWEATGSQFAEPYVFKTLFSKDDIEFDDLCVTKSVTSEIYMDFNEKLNDVTVAEKELANRIFNRKVDVNLSRPKRLNPDFVNKTDDDIQKIIDKGHNYVFLGKSGRFCPVVDGVDGSLLMRHKDGKYDSVGGTKGYRWLEAEVISEHNKEHLIDRSYFDTMVEKAVENMSQFGDVEEFVNVFEPKQEIIDSYKNKEVDVYKNIF